MILTGRQIALEVRRGAITIDPFDEGAINPNSYNYRLGPTLRTLRHHTVDSLAATATDEVTIGPEGVVLRPGRVYLGTTVETIGSAQFVPSLIGRSSLGRLGVYLQVSADLGNLGAVHCWTLELVVCQPIRLYAGMKVGQVSFWVPTGEKLPYHGFFGQFSQAMTPRPDLFRLDEEKAWT